MKRTRRKTLSRSGMTLTELMIGLGISSLALLAVTTTVTSMGRMEKGLEDDAAALDLFQEVRMALSSQKTCATALRDQNGDPPRIDLTTLQFVPDASNKPRKVRQIRSHSAVVTEGQATPNPKFRVPEGGIEASIKPGESGAESEKILLLMDLTLAVEKKSAIGTWKAFKKKTFNIFIEVNKKTGLIDACYQPDSVVETAIAYRQGFALELTGCENINPPSWSYLSWVNAGNTTNIDANGCPNGFPDTDDNGVCSDGTYYYGICLDGNICQTDSQDLYSSQLTRVDNPFKGGTLWKRYFPKRKAGHTIDGYTVPAATVSNEGRCWVTVIKRPLGMTAAEDDKIFFVPTLARTGYGHMQYLGLGCNAKNGWTMLSCQHQTSGSGDFDLGISKDAEGNSYCASDDILQPHGDDPFENGFQGITAVCARVSQ